MLLDHESSRLSVLHRYDILGTPKEVEFDKITALAAQLFDVGLACITLVDRHQFFFKSTAGSEVRYLERQSGFCDTTIQQEGVYCIEDTAKEPLVMDHPLVIEPPHIRSYAGSPLRTSDGFAIGTLCLMDSSVRVYSEAERQLLQELAEFAMYQLDRRRLQAEAAEYEENRRNVQKLESLGMLSGGIAHDFNNLLVGVLGHASLAARQIGEDSPAHDAIGNVIQAAKQASELTDQLLAYAGQRPSSPKAVDMAALIGNMSSLLHSSTSPDITIEVEQADDLATVSGDPTQLRQVILNLIANASESYLDEPGVVRVVLANTTIGPPGVGEDYGADLKVGRYARIDVVDTGCGMEAKTLKSMFNPFFSTKVSGRGLGMSIVQRIVRSHGGVIQVESSPGEGCTVCILLPTDTATVDRKVDTSRSNNQLIAGNGVALIVDDEELVMRMAMSAATALGFEASGALSGSEALLRMQELTRLDVLILDATMSGMSGASTLNALREHQAHVPTVVTSGHHIDEVAAMFDDLEGLTFLHKPWTIEQFSEAIQEALEKQAGSAQHTIS